MSPVPTDVCDASDMLRFTPPNADYPLRPGLAGPLTRADVGWLVALALLAAVPRLAVALTLGPVCDDGYFYLAVADASDRGDRIAAVSYLNVNAYPALLSGLHRLGFDMLAAAKAWGVLAGVLTLLPLYGWVRRLLDRATARAACAVYAVHPEFIELSPEPIRDTTFWLFVALGFYFLWRAASDRSLPLFAAGGLVIALAAHTRTEGWLLLLPGLIWPLVRWREWVGDRLRLAAGFACYFAAVPLFLIAFNLTALAGHDRWEWGKLEHFRRGWEWAAGHLSDADLAATVPAPLPAPPVSPPAVVALPTTAAPVPPPPAPAVVAPRPRPESAVRTYFNSFCRSLGAVPLLLMFAGLLGWPRLTVRREHLVLSACFCAVLSAVAFRLEEYGEINGRYFLLAFFPALPAAGLGLRWFLWRAEQLVSVVTARPGAVVAVAAAILAAVHLGEGVRKEHPSRIKEEQLARRLAAVFGPRPTLVTPPASRVGYIWCGRVPIFAEMDATPFPALLARHRPEVVILEHGRTPVEVTAVQTAEAEAFGLRRIDLTGMPLGNRFLVLVRPEIAARAAAVNSPGTVLR